LGAVNFPGEANMTPAAIAVTVVAVGLSLVLSAARLTPALADDVPPSINLVTFHGDPQRTGWNSMETILTPANVSGPAFGPLWNSLPFDPVTIAGTDYAAHMYASPLYVDDVLIGGGPYVGGHFATVVAATGNGFVYAVNAFDGTAGGAVVPAGTILWRTRLGTPSRGPDGGVPLGVLSTPTIDLNATPPRIYVAADTTEGGRSWKVFALDLTSGSVLPGWPLIIDDGALAPINQNGPTTFQSTGAMSQRGGLNLSLDGGVLYVPFGAYGDRGAGFMVAIDTATPSLTSAFAGAPSGSRAFANGGMWGSGGPAIDPAGGVYATTGNGPNDIRDAPGYWGESLLVWGPGSPLQLIGTYTPWNYCQMDDADTDLGGDTPMIIPDLDPSTTSTPHLVAFGSKQGTVYLVDRDNVPGRLDQRQPCNPTDPTVDGSLLGPAPQPPFGTVAPLSVFGPYSEVYTMSDNARARTTPAYFQGADGTSYVFYSGSTKRCESCRDPVPPGLARLQLVLSPGAPAYLSIDATDSALSMFSPGSPVVTSNGSSDPIVWVLDANLYRSAPLIGAGVPHPVLYAIDGTTMNLLWNSTPSQLNVGGKYNHPTIARGVVFVGTDRIQAFGLAPAPSPPTISRLNAASQFQ
jgi:outer membrane protein assembly factor BamB